MKSILVALSVFLLLNQISAGDYQYSTINHCYQQGVLKSSLSAIQLKCLDATYLTKCARFELPTEINSHDTNGFGKFCDDMTASGKKYGAGQIPSDKIIAYIQAKYNMNLDLWKCIYESFVRAETWPESCK